MVVRNIKSKKNLCMVNTPYSLFLYFLICGYNEEDIFVLTNRIPKEIRDNVDHIYFPLSGVPLQVRESSIKYFFYILRIIYEVFILRVKLYFKTRGYEISVYGHAQFVFSFPFYEYENSYIIEDGTGNYIELSPFNEFPPFKKLIFGKVFGKYIDKETDGWGTHPNIKKVYLTRNEGYSKLIGDKVVSKPIVESIKSLTDEDKVKILQIFNFEDILSENISSDAVLLLTEAYCESHLLDVDEEVRIYSEMISNYDEENVFIKPHPRDEKDYNKYFPKSKVINAKFPLEVVHLLDIDFKKILIVESTAAFNFDCEVEFYEGEISNNFINESRRRIKKQYYDFRNNKK